MGLKDFFKFGDDQWGLPAEHLEGVPGVLYKQNIGLLTQQEERCISITTLPDDREIAVLLFRHLVQVNYIDWEGTLTHERDPVAEAFWGSMIGGTAVGVASAISAQGKTWNERVKCKNALEIRYYPGNDRSKISRIVVSPNIPASMAQKWAKTVSRCAGLSEPRYAAPLRPEVNGPKYL